MTYPGCGKKTKGGKHRKHTPIVSKAQQGMFGTELARRRKGKSPEMRGIITAELEGHLKESKGKKLPKRKHAPLAYDEDKKEIREERKRMNRKG